MGIKCKPEGLWYRGIAAGLRLFQMAFWLQKKDVSRLPNVSHHKNANATGSCAALRLPLPSMIVVSRRHDAKFSPTFINSWQRAAPEFPMIPPVLCVILPHLSLFAGSHSVPLMAELLTLFLVLCTLDTTHFLHVLQNICYKAVGGGGFIVRSKNSNGGNVGEA